MGQSDEAGAGVGWARGLHAAGAAAIDADAYFRYLGQWSALFVPATLAGAEVSAGATVLDVASGPGEAARQASAVVGSHGCVIGTDISLGMLVTARGDLPVGSRRLVAADAQALPFASDCFDAVICQLGLMFVPDPTRGLREFHRVLKPGGRVAVCVISTAERSPMWGALAQALCSARPAEAETLALSFSLGQPAQLESVFRAAGLRDVQVHREQRTANLSSFEEYWSVIEAGVGQLPHAYATLPEPTRRTVRHEVRERLMAHQASGRLELPIEMIIAAGRATKVHRAGC